MGLAAEGRSIWEIKSRADRCGGLWHRARKELARIFSRIIQARRDSNSKEDDMLQSFIDSRYEKVPISAPMLSADHQCCLKDHGRPSTSQMGLMVDLARQG